ncbi:MAG: hypothetical protein ACLT74_02955 [Christensenellales bacterium]
MRNARALQWIAIILAVLFVLSLLPVMAVAFYTPRGRLHLRRGAAQGH